MRNHRRALLAAGISLPFLGRRARASGLIRIGTTPVILDDQIGLLARWQRYLQDKLDRPVRFVQRGSYREIMDLLLNDGMEVAWVCGYPYVVNERRLRLLAVPLYQYQPLYRSHLIVADTDTSTRHISELQGKIFAFSDPGSNSGYLVPRVELLRSHLQPDGYFSRSFFTFGHSKVVEAVQVGLAQAGSVDGYVWDTLAAQRPDAVKGIRVAWRSPLHGFPPIVARSSLAEPDFDVVTEALLGMTQDREGKVLLRDLNIDGFIKSSPQNFDSIRTLVGELVTVERPRA